MKTLKHILFLLAVLSISFSCQSQTAGKQDQEENTVNEDVTVYYFHFTRRCATCKAVEAEAENAVSELYGEQVSFKSYNLDNDKGAEMGERTGVSGQKLLIISGNKKIDITKEGFMYARSKPEKLKNIIKEKINNL